VLSEFYAKPPEEISERELEDYFLHRKNVDHWSANTMRIFYCGIRFFFVHVLQRNRHLFQIEAREERSAPAHGAQPRGSTAALGVRAHCA
jgi:integrase/recombinase XerD